jgi:hypothetical protein
LSSMPARAVLIRALARGVHHEVHREHEVLRDWCSCRFRGGVMVVLLKDETF